VFATVVAAIWTILDRRRLAYPRLQEWMRIVIRLFSHCQFGLDSA